MTMRPIPRRCPFSLLQSQRSRDLRVMKPEDTISVEVERLGVLTNLLVGEE